MTLSSMKGTSLNRDKRIQAEKEMEALQRYKDTVAGLLYGFI